MSLEPSRPPDGDPGLASFAPARSLRSALGGIASVVAPTTLVSALLYYFGWVRASAQADVIGLDHSLLGFSTQDYLLSSISPMFWPLAVGLVAMLAGLLLHGAVITWAAAAGPRRQQVLRWSVVALSAVAAGCLALSAYAFSRGESRFLSLASPLGMTFSIVLASYAVHLHHRFVRPVPAGDASPELKAVRLVSSSVATLLVLLTLFWAVAHYAGIRGIDLARKLERELNKRPSVTVYSGARLHLPPQVEEAQLPGPDSAYRFRYTGLKLLFRSERRYFLRPSRVSEPPANIVIPEKPDVRFEFARGE